MREKQTLLITGAAGRVGTFYRLHLLRNHPDRYNIRLTDIQPIEEANGLPTDICDLADPAAAQRVCEGVDTVLHLGANPHTDAEFYAGLLEPNFKGVYNMFRAAKDQSCKRLVFASSINAVGGTPSDYQVRESDAPCPGNVYGASKAFGESLGSYFARVEGLSTICVRIGAVASHEQVEKHGHFSYLSIIVTEDDLCHLFDRCIETPDITFAVVHGLSNNRFNRMSITETKRLLQYNPKDDAFALYEAANPR